MNKKKKLQNNELFCSRLCSKLGWLVYLLSRDNPFNYTTACGFGSLAVLRFDKKMREFYCKSILI